LKVGLASNTHIGYPQKNRNLFYLATHKKRREKVIVQIPRTLKGVSLASLESE